MPVCRFYLQGRCRYGDRCWSEHTNPSPLPQRRDSYPRVSPYSSSYGNYSSAQFSTGHYASSCREPSSRSRSPTRNQYSGRYGPSSLRYEYNHPASKSLKITFATNENASPELKTSDSDVVMNSDDDTGKNDKDNSKILSIIDEVNEWENSHMWPFSCHSDFENPGKCVAGFVDVSPEELRHVAYESEKHGIFPSYVEILGAASDEIKKKWNLLKNPTPEILQAIENGYYVTPVFCEENLKNLILGPHEVTVSPSGGEQQGSEIFPQAQTESTTSEQPSFKLAHLCRSEALGNSSAAFQSMSPPGFESSGITSSAGSTASSSFGLSSESHSPIIKASGDSSDVKSCGTQVQNLTDNEKAQFSPQTFTVGNTPSQLPPV